MPSEEGGNHPISLDRYGRCGHAARKALYPYRLYCQRIDAAKNMARYYVLSIQPTLFGEVAVMRAWRRIGKLGGEKCKVFATERDAVMHFLELARQKHLKGYRPVDNSSSPGIECHSTGRH